MTISKEKKTLLLSIIVVGIAATMLGAGTLAYFSSTVTAEDNLFTAGTIELAVDGQETNWTGLFTAELTDLKPCMKGWGNVTLTNTGTNPLNAYLIIPSVDITTADVTATTPEGVEDPSYNIHDLDGVIRYDLYVDGSPIIEDGDDYTISTGTHGLTTSGIVDQYIFIDEIPPAGSVDVNQSFTLDCDTTNWAQGDTMEFTVVFYALQSEGSPAPVPTPILTP